MRWLGSVDILATSLKFERAIGRLRGFLWRQEVRWPKSDSCLLPASPRPGDLQSDADKRQESDFGHRTSCLHRKPRKRPIALSNFNEVARMSTEPSYLINVKRTERSISSGASAKKAGGRRKRESPFFL